MLFGDEFIEQAVKWSGMDTVHIKHDGFQYFLLPSGSFELHKFAEAVYAQGRKEQRESDAALCRKKRHNKDTIPENLAWDNGTRWCEEAIRNNTGDTKCQNPK